MTKPWAFIIRDIKIAASYRLQFLMQGVGIVLTTFTFSLVGKLVDNASLGFLEPYGGNYFSFVLIGIAFTDFLVISTNTFAQEIRKAQMLGTLEALLVTPTSLLTILLSSYFYNLGATSLRTVFYLGVGSLIFGVQFQASGLLPLFLAFSLTLLPFFGLGLLSAAFIIVLKQGSPISFLMGMSSGLLGGVIYPVAILPAWLKPLSTLLPITHGLEAMRQILLSKAQLVDIAPQLYILLAFSVVFLLAGISAIHVSLGIAKKEGSLLHY